MTTNPPIKPKLHPPLLGRDIVTRARLLDRLSYHRPLALVVAPAGYGKTTLVADWVERTRYPCAWLSLDAYDDSLPGFTSYVLAAVETLFSGACAETRSLLNSATPPPPAAIAHSLVNELEALPGRFALVLDDYHTIGEMAVHELMAELLHYQPRALEIVLIARHDPPLPLPPLRARNRVTEIRAQELRFLREESRTFLERASDLPVGDEQIAALDEMIEGWPAGLRLAALLMQQGDAAEGGLGGDGSGRFAMEYLADEVVANLPPAMQEFLVKTSFMERVCADLCAAVLEGRPGAEQCQRYLDTLAQNSLFVFALHGAGAGGGWFRYHHLLRMVLQRLAEGSLGAAARATLHARASAWLEAHGQSDAALVHAVLAGDVQAVADFVRRHRHDLLNPEDWAGLETWRRLIPRAMIEQHPQLLMLDAWSHSHHAALARLAASLDAIEALLAAAPLPAREERLLRSEMDTVRAEFFFWTADAQRCVETARRALDAAPPAYAFARSYAWLLWIVGLQAAGQAEAAATALDAALGEASPGRADTRAMFVLSTACVFDWLRADMVRMNERAGRVLSLAQERGHAEFVAFGHFFRGCARYQQDDLAAAREDFAAVAGMAYAAHPVAYSQAMIGLAATCYAQGDVDRAYATARQGRQHFQDTGAAHFASILAGYVAYLDFRCGNLDEALGWVAKPSPFSLNALMWTFYSARLGRAAILLGERSAEAHAEATALLAELRAGLERAHDTRFLIEALALQAAALAAPAGPGNEEEVLGLLERAVLLTVPGQAVRALADLDFLIGPLLDRLARRAGVPTAVRSQIRRIRRAAVVRPPAAAQAGGDGHAPLPQPPPARHPDLLEALTNRELDVLVLLLDRPTNKEIARQLNISTATVKGHLVNIFQKLHVENRRQAIVQARLLGLLPPKT